MTQTPILLDLRLRFGRMLEPCLLQPCVVEHHHTHTYTHTHTHNNNNNDNGDAANNNHSDTHTCTYLALQLLVEPELLVQLVLALLL